MAEEFARLAHAAQRKTLEMAVDAALKARKKDREKTYLQILNVAKTFYGKNIKPESFENVRKAIQDPDNKWIRFINRVLDETDPNVAKTTLLNLGYEAFFRGTSMIRKNREKYDCNIPWLILFDPTSACNMHCTGCWAAEYGHKQSLSYEVMDKVLTEGKPLGLHACLFTGGEPLLRKGMGALLRRLSKQPELRIEIETNGSVDLTPFAGLSPAITFTMDYKLPGSGMEAEMCTNNLRLLSPDDTVKFVAGSREDLLRALEIIRQYDLTHRCHVYLSPVFGRIEPAEMVAFMQEHVLNDVTLQLQMHKIIWDPNMRGV
ncbi:MAG TPA: hypothetical protein DDX51_00070 [Clostridiales bacterium]|nr:hypothetical protein [Clostridiales bacterium]